jgi:hypothetical protein
MAENAEKIEEEFDVTKERFSFMPGSSRTPIQRYYHDKKPHLAEVSPSPTAPVYDPSKSTTKIGLADKIYAERCSRCVFASGFNKLPTILLPKRWMIMWEIDWLHKQNAMDLVKLEMSADRQEIRIKRVPNPPGMNRPVDYEVFMTTDSDEFAEVLEEESNNNERKE